MSAALKKAILTVYRKDDDFDAAIEDVKASIGRMRATEFTELAMTLASEKYGVGIKRAASSGRLMWDSKAENFETARKRVQRLVAALFSKTPKEDVEIPAELLKAARALAKAAKKYEDARSLASKALSDAFSK